MRTIALDKFSGPLDMLLHLVEEEKLSINEISLAEVADKYIASLKVLQEATKEELSMFLVIAATLMLIKSRSLIPNFSLSEEEEQDIQELEGRLRIFQFFKIFTGELAKLHRRNLHLFAREPYAGMQSVFIPPPGVTPKTLGQLISSIIEAMPTTEVLPEEAIKKTLSIEEKMKDFKNRLERAMNVSFDEIKKGAKEKAEVIVSFLAILELIRQGFLLFEQKSLFGTIDLKKGTNE